MPVENVHLHEGHAVEVSLEYVEWDEVTADVNHQAAPREAWLVFDRDRRYHEALGCDRDQLQESLQTVKRAQRVGGCNLCAGVGDGELIRLVFAEFQQRRNWLFSAHRQCACRFRLGLKRNPGLTRQLIGEAMNSCLKRGIV